MLGGIANKANAENKELWKVDINAMVSNSTIETFPYALTEVNIENSFRIDSSNKPKIGNISIPGVSGITPSIFIQNPTEWQIKGAETKILSNESTGGRWIVIKNCKAGQLLNIVASSINDPRNLTAIEGGYTVVTDGWVAFSIPRYGNLSSVSLTGDGYTVTFKSSGGWGVAGGVTVSNSITGTKTSSDKNEETLVVPSGSTITVSAPEIGGTDNRLLLKLWKVDGNNKYDGLPSNGLAENVSRSFTMTVNADVSIEAAYAINYIAKMLTASNGTAKVTYNGNDVTETTYFRGGTTIKLEANAADDYHLEKWKVHRGRHTDTSWTEDELDLDNDNPYSYTLPTDNNGWDLVFTPVFAEGEENKAKVTFSAPKVFGWADPNTPNNCITAYNVTQDKTINSGDKVNIGDQIRFTALQFAGESSQTNGDATIGEGRLVLYNWEINGVEDHTNIPSTGIVWSGKTSEYTCTVTENIEIKAIYGLSYRISFNSATGGNGTATAKSGSNNLSQWSGMKQGTEITITAEPESGYSFDHWEGALYGLGTDPVWTDNNWSTSSTFTFTIDPENTFDYAYGYDIKVTPVFKEATPELKQPSTILTKVSGHTSYTINLKEQVNNLKSSDAVTYDSPTIIKDGNTPTDGVNATSNLSASISGDNLTINSANDVDGGAVVVNVKVNGNKIGTYIINVPYIGNHTWDFHQMANKSEHSTSGDFILDYEVVEGSTYKNPMTVYNTKVDGNNAAIIDATNGLSITTGNKNNMSLAAIGPETTSTSKASLADVKGVWLVGMKNATLTIPQVKKDWFIKMYLLPHSGASQASGAGTEFTVNNLKDLNGKEINPNHTLVTNGVFRNNNIMDLIHDKGNIQGCMIFRVKENGNVDFNFSNNGWDKIVKIVVADTYSTELMLGCTGTDTKVVDYFRHNHNLVYREYDSSYGKTNTTAVATYNGHPQVHAENAKYIDMTISKYTTDATGKQIQGSITGATMENYQWTSGGGVTYQGGKISANNGVGNIKVISNATYSGMVKDNGWEAKDSYVLNSNESWLAVGKLKVQKYPYTWDFTKYNTEKGTTAASISSNIESVPNDTLYGAWSTGGWYNKVVKVYGTPGETSPYYRVDATGKKIYDIEIVKPLFAFGSQLTYGTTAIPETEGLGITPYNAYYVSGDYSHTGTTYQNQITLSNGDNMSFTRVVTVTIPEVPAGMYVFIKSSNDPTTVTNTKTSDVTFAPNADGNVYYYQAEADGDINITLPEKTSVYRIGVTDQVKEFTTYHWTTESRALDIDYNETPLFSANVKTYYTADNAYSSSTAMVTLNEVTSQTHIPAGTGLIMHDLSTTAATVVKVPLFVPAVNIAPTAQTGFSTASEGVLVGTTKADGSNNTVYKSVAGAGNYSYFTLSNLIKTINPADYGITIDTEKEVLPGFYRYVGSDVNINNKAFIKLLSTSVSAKSNDCIFLNFADGSSTNINIIGSNGIVELQDAKMYNLQGIRVNSANKGGIYIINGKKVFIKK